MCWSDQIKSADLHAARNRELNPRNEEVTRDIGEVFYRIRMLLTSHHISTEEEFVKRRRFDVVFCLIHPLECLLNSWF